jgi:hypothetical protein
MTRVVLLTCPMLSVSMSKMVVSVGNTRMLNPIAIAEFS